MRRDPVEEFLDDQPTNRLRLRGLAKLGVHSLNAGHVLETTDDIQELNGEPGVLVRVEAIDRTVGSSLSTARWMGCLETTIRRSAAGAAGELAVSVGEFIALEDGVEVSFSGTRFREGDYWVIAARTATGDVIWPTQDDEPLAQPPLGIAYHHERLRDGRSPWRHVRHRLRLPKDVPAAHPECSENTAGRDGRQPGASARWHHSRDQSRSRFERAVQCAIV